MKQYYKRRNQNPYTVHRPLKGVLINRPSIPRYEEKKDNEMWVGEDGRRLRGWGGGRACKVKLYERFYRDLEWLDGGLE